MALIQCPECGTAVSTFAKACPKCGYPISEMNKENSQQENKNVLSNENIENRLEDGPSFYNRESSRSSNQESTVPNFIDQKTSTSSSTTSATNHGCLKVFAIIIGLFFLFSFISPSSSRSSGNSSSSYSSSSSTSSSSSSSATLGEKNALKSANSYLRSMAFSRSGLIKQLEYEGYTKEEATYAVDHCGADWKEQAAKSAASYLRTMSFSRDGLIKQLEYEGFTHEQAVYGVEQNGY